MKKNHNLGIGLFTFIVCLMLMLRKLMDGSDNYMLKEMLFIGDLIIGIRFVLFMGLIFIILGLANHNAKHK